MHKSKPRRQVLDPTLAKTLKKLWTIARKEVRKKTKDDTIRRQRLAFLAQQHLSVASELVKIADFLFKKSIRATIRT
jgi:hypothetical protein